MRCWTLAVNHLPTPLYPGGTPAEAELLLELRVTFPWQYPRLAPPLFEIDAKSDGVDADELVGELGDTASIAMLQGESCMGACYPTLVAYTQQAVERAVNERAGVPLSHQVSL